MAISHRRSGPGQDLSIHCNVCDWCQISCSVEVEPGRRSRAVYREVSQQRRWLVVRGFGSGEEGRCHVGPIIGPVDAPKHAVISFRIPKFI